MARVGQRAQKVETLHQQGHFRAQHRQPQPRGVGAESMGLAVDLLAGPQRLHQILSQAFGPQARTWAGSLSSPG